MPNEYRKCVICGAEITPNQEFYGDMPEAHAVCFDKRRVVEFNENDCGGAFDGSRVTSDADSGL